jgi:holo-[acyl-carrier protein] synthase
MNVVGIGTEIIECVRIAKMIERHGELFLERVYTPGEVDFCSQRSSPIQHYAARWAAKEAVVKAICGRGNGVRWDQIEVPGEVRLTLASCRTHATAFAIALSPRPIS